MPERDEIDGQEIKQAEAEPLMAEAQVDPEAFFVEVPPAGASAPRAVSETASESAAAADEERKDPSRELFALEGEMAVLYKDLSVATADSGLGSGLPQRLRSILARLDSVRTAQERSEATAQEIKAQLEGLRQARQQTRSEQSKDQPNIAIPDRIL